MNTVSLPGHWWCFRDWWWQAVLLSSWTWVKFQELYSTLKYVKMQDCHAQTSDNNVKLTNWLVNCWDISKLAVIALSLLKKTWQKCMKMTELSVWSVPLFGGPCGSKTSPYSSIPTIIGTPYPKVWMCWREAKQAWNWSHSNASRKMSSCCNSYLQ